MDDLMNGNKPAVLIVDNEEVICEGLSRLLSAEHETHYALCGKTALDILRDKKIDIILCDLLMPEMDGLSLISRIREKDSDVSIVVITACAEPRKVCEAMKRGANDFLLKPLDISRLQLLMRSMVKRRRKVRDCSSHEMSQLITFVLDSGNALHPSAMSF